DAEIVEALQNGSGTPHDQSELVVRIAGAGGNLDVEIVAKLAGAVGGDGERLCRGPFAVGKTDVGGRGGLRDANDIKPRAAVVKELQRGLGQETIGQKSAIVCLEFGEAGHQHGRVQRTLFRFAEESRGRSADALDRPHSAGDLLNVDTWMQ